MKSVYETSINELTKFVNLLNETDPNYATLSDPTLSSKIGTEFIKLLFVFDYKMPAEVEH